MNLSGRILVFGGACSNLQALQAVLAEAERRDIPAARIFCLGDSVAYGADAAATFRLLQNTGIPGIAGNCERQLAGNAPDCGCGFAPGSACDLLATSWYAHARRQIGAAERAAMAQLPDRLDLELNGKRLCLVHGNVERINAFVFPSASQTELARQLDLAGADAVIGGHSGIPFTRLVGGKIWHNPGSIGMPANDGTPRGWFSVVEVVGGALCIETLPLAYDFAAAAAAMRAARLPEGYAAALESGIWPSLDILPQAERLRTGIPLEAEPESEPAPVLALERLETLWVNTGTLCNLACAGCFMESSPSNDSLAYFPAAALRDMLVAAPASLAQIGFTGGEPFMNPEILVMLEAVLAAGLQALVLSNAMRPMHRLEDRLAALARRFPGQLAVRVSLDHFSAPLHEALRGEGSFAPALSGLKALGRAGIGIAVAARTPWGETEAMMRAGFARLFAAEGIALDAQDPGALILFPEMDAASPVPPVTRAALAALPEDRRPMCATSRMVVFRRGETLPETVPCTLLPARSLADAAAPVALDHPHCARFCVLGGASCAGAPG
ncbi:MAG: hypothetical protein B7Z80_14620 [Rhodospirillales bacterium 20-64-7]|nr:MAG: hypothetical protein B7Z80_14620 [Rhodospirillales bacterium 20-64-7]